MQGSPLAFLIIYIRSHPQTPLPVAVACPPSEELKALLMRTMSHSTTHTKRPLLGTQHSVTNASNCNLGTKSRTAPRTDAVAFATATSTNQSCASPRICVATKMSARCLVGTTTTACIAPPTPLGGSPAS